MGDYCLFDFVFHYPFFGESKREVVFMRTLLILFLGTFLWADGEADLLSLAAIQDAFFTSNGRYIRTDPTPVSIPNEGTDTKITQLIKAGGGENETITFTPTAKDYQFHAMGWVSTENFSVASGKPQVIKNGYRIIAKRVLASGVIETLEYINEP